MTRRSWTLLIARWSLIAITFHISFPAAAETVLLSRGQGEYGLGWLFLQQDGRCRIATPRHVIEADDGTLVPADMLDKYGRPHATFDPVPASSPDLDLAFLEIRGTLAEEGCSTSRLSVIAVKTALDQMQTAVLAIATPFDRQTLHIERRATSRDAEGGLIVAIGPRPGSPALMQGMSGGAVLVENRPVAMLIEVDTLTGTGIALRFDVIAEELGKLKSTVSAPTARTAASIQELMLISGHIAQKDSNVSTFIAGRSPLVVEPDKERFSAVARLNKPIAIDQVSVSANSSRKMPSKFIVEVAPAKGGFVPAAICDLQMNNESVSCRFSPRLIDRIRVTIPISQTIKITQLEFSSPDIEGSDHD